MSISVLLASLLMAAAVQSSAVTIAYRGQATTTQPKVFLSDVANIEALPLPMRRMASQVEVAALKDETFEQEIAVSEITRRMRLRAPTLGHWLGEPAPSTFIRIQFFAHNAASRIATDTPPPLLTCLQARRSFGVGEAALASEFDKVACPVGYNLPRTFRYDRNGGVQTVRAIAAHEVTRRFIGYGQDLVLPGQIIRMVSVAGSVSVARDVEVLQSARPGAKLFVRSTDGAVFPLLYAGQGQ